MLKHTITCVVKGSQPQTYDMADYQPCDRGSEPIARRYVREVHRMSSDENESVTVTAEEFIDGMVVAVWDFLFVLKKVQREFLIGTSKSQS